VDAGYSVRASVSTVGIDRLLHISLDRDGGQMKTVSLIAVLVLSVPALMRAVEPGGSPVPSAGTQPVRDLNYRVIGYREQRGDKTIVRDCHFVLLGYSDASGTYDAVGRKLFPQPVPDLLLDRSPCRTKEDFKWR
jgi:hypothetical protein